jgi:uncharacterized RDD family membrane protein YckC
MEHVQIQTAQNVGIRFEVAGLGDRVVAALIDYILLAAYVTAALLVLTALGWLGSLAATSLIALPYLLYFLACEIFFDGQSVGKRLLHIRVIRLDGDQPTVGHYLLRWLLRPIDITLSTGLIGLVSILVTRHGQRLGDLAAGTTVVKLRQRTRLGDTLYARLEDDYVPTFLEVDRLTDHDVETAKEVLDALTTQRRSPTTNALGMEIKAALTAKMNISSDLAPVPFLRTVIDDYNHRAGRV